MAESSVFSKIEIIIEGYNKNGPVIFSDLSLTESFISVNTFSFLMRPSGNEATTLDAIISFKKQVLGKEVEMQFKDGDALSHKFKGVIMKVNSSLTDNDFYEFSIEGCGIFRKINELSQYRSFYKKKLDAIIGEVFQDSSLKNNVKKNPQTTAELHYIVQYDQTAFDFCVSLATRFGEWMFYDGEELHFGKKPQGNAVELVMQRDVNNVNIKAQTVRLPKGIVSTDIFKSAVIEATSKEQAPGNDIIKAAESSGSGSIEEASGNMFVPSGFTQDVIKEKFKLEQQAIMASSVYITGDTRTAKLSVGAIIKIKDTPNDGGKNYILTQIQHTAINSSNYMNSFTAVPEEVEVPPYTDPFYVCKAASQPAVITDNEDDAGLARVKVKFPWMADEEKSPWISVLVPHAGKDKGFRFLPEKDDEVMVDFWDSNVETPFVNGALYTEKNVPGIAEEGNNIKRIGSRSGRRFDINDDEGYMLMADSLQEQPKNIIRLSMNDNEQELALQSLKDENNFGIIILNNGEDLSIGLQAGGELVAQLRLLKEGPKILIKTKGDIDIDADGSINMNAKKDINIKAGGAVNYAAQQDVKMDATGDFKVTAMNVEMKGNVAFKAEGMLSEVKGVQAVLKGDAMTTVKGGLVLIN